MKGGCFVKWSFDDDRPIYSQIARQIEAWIVRGELLPGGAVPSVRDLAAEAGVNPNTMQRALAGLEERGLLRSHRTSGRVVTEDTEVIEKLRKDAADEQIRAFLAGMSQLGISASDTVKMVRAALDENKKGEEE
jgi:DNA-binding transcriptional regulator YhcF (GntR family)